MLCLLLRSPAYFLLLLVLVAFETGSHYVALIGLELICKPGWPGAHRNSPVSASHVLGLREHISHIFLNKSFSFSIEVGYGVFTVDVMPSLSR